MNKRVKRIWIKALRSGRYKQTRNALRYNGGFCCLGVLCDLYRKDTGDGEWDYSSFIDSTGASSTVIPPRRVQRWAGLEDGNPLLGRELVATELNDRGRSFTFIADRIEKYL